MVGGVWGLVDGGVVVSCLSMWLLFGHVVVLVMVGFEGVADEDVVDGDCEMTTSCMVSAS